MTRLGRVDRPDRDGVLDRPHPGAPRHGWTAPVLGLVTTVALTVVTLPVNLLATWMLLVSLTSYDSSGQGGPFRSCGPDSIQCDGGNPFGVIASLLVIAAMVVGTGFAGQAAGRHRSKLLGRSVMAGLSVLLTAGVAVVITATR